MQCEVTKQNVFYSIINMSKQMVSVARMESDCVLRLGFYFFRKSISQHFISKLKQKANLKNEINATKSVKTKFNLNRKRKKKLNSGVVKKHFCPKFSSDEIIVQVLSVSYLFGNYFPCVLSCKGTHSCSSHKVIHKFHCSGTVHSYTETKK